MATLDDVLRIQNEQGILMAPAPTQTSGVSRVRPDGATATPPTMQIALRNNTSSSNVFANVSGLAINNNNAVFLLQSDGQTVYYPANPSQDQQPLQANVSIALGAPGTTRTITVPQCVGARVWYSKDTPLTFKLNHGANGPGLVEPSVTNPSDPSYNVTWDFCEFTYNSFQVFANITYVDFVSLPAALRLVSTDGSVQDVLGIPQNGLDTICSQLQQQQAADGAPWASLVVRGPSGANLRALSPNNGIVLNPSLFQNYWNPYVDAVWAKYATTQLRVDTQVQWGTVSGTVSGAPTPTLNFPSVGSFPKPSARDIFSCSTGAFAPYAVNGDEMGNITARLAAAFNRSTLLVNPDQPDGESVATYYQTSPTNHYSRILHAVNLDHRGYAFPYDDVGPSSAPDQAGAVASQIPQLLTIFIGGNGGSTTTKMRLRDIAVHDGQLVAGRRPRRARRGLEEEAAWPTAEEEKAAAAATAALGRDDDGVDDDDNDTRYDSGIDLEKGRDDGLWSQGKLAKLRGDSLSDAPEEMTKTTTTLKALVPTALARRTKSLLRSLEASPVYARLKPAADLLVRLVVAVLSLSARAVASRIAMLVCFVIFYLLLGPLGKVIGHEEQAA